MKIGVLADDATGANDVGVAFHKGGAGVKIVTTDKFMNIESDSDVLVIDTDSRFDSAHVAYEKVYAATIRLEALGLTHFYKKTCSALRGNIGAEFEALLEAADIQSMIVCAAYPANGRSTVNGRHFIHGTLLENTNFRSDPIHPMTMSNLEEIIHIQSSRSSIIIPLEEVRKGCESLKQVLVSAAKSHSFLIVDGETQEDLAILAEASRGFSAFGGSAALGEELSRFLGPLQGPIGIDDNLLSNSGGCLVVCGSLTPQTLEQTNQLLSTGVTHSMFKSTDIYNPEACGAWLEKTVDLGRSTLSSGSDFLIHSSQDPETVKATKELAREHAFDDTSLGKQISALLAEACAHIMVDSPPYPLIVAGGDTAGSVCERSGIRGNRILEEIDTGIPMGLTLDNPRLIVLKSGSFGKPDFLIRACRRAHELCQA